MIFRETRRARLERELAIARAAVTDTTELLNGKARPWYEASGLALRDEPAIQLAAGRIAVGLATAEAAVEATKTSEARLHDARLLVGEAALAAASHLFEAAGALSSDDPADFGRHWLAARASTLEDPLATAAIAAGRAFLETPEDLPSDPIAQRAATLAALLSKDAATRNRRAGISEEALAAFAASGLLGVNVPTAYGGDGAGFATAVEVSRIVSAADGSLGQISTIHYSMIEQLVRQGSEAHKSRWLPRAVAGGRFGNAAAERDVEHAKITATRLTPEGPDQYRLSGRKFYSTGAPGSVLVIVLAQHPEGGLASVLVPADAPGLEIQDDWRGLGQRGTGSGTTLLNDILVSKDDVLPIWINAAIPSTATAAANLAHVAIDLGLARGALTAARAHLQDKDVDVGILGELGRLAARLFGGEALFAAARRKLAALEGQSLTDEDVRRYSLEVSVVKAQAADLALDAGERIFDLIGPEALDPAAGLDRFWRDARTHSLHDPTRWRLIRIGDHLLTGRLPPRNRTN